MRYPASEKAEIIKLVEQSHLPAKSTRAVFPRYRTNFSVVEKKGSRQASERTLFPPV